MTPLNLEQTLSYLRERMPAPFDLPQLAHLCRQGKLTPLFAYNDFAMDYHEYLETRAEGLDFSLLGYVTNQKLISLIESNKPLHISIATVYECTNSSDYLTDETRQALEGRTVFLLAKQFNYSQYQNDENYTVFSDKDGVTITRNDLLFDLEQLESIAPAGDTQTSQRKNALAHSATDTTAHTPADDEPTHHKSIGSMTALIATLLKMAEYDKADLEQPTGEINKIIVAKAQTLGLKVEKDFIAKWLKNAYEAL